MCTRYRRTPPWTEPIMGIGRKLPRLTRRGSRSRGFSLLELMIVLTIIMILASIAAGRYDRSVQRSREAVLKQDLYTMRQAIQQYTLDKQAAPTSLDDLVSS